MFCGLADWPADSWLACWRPGPKIIWWLQKLIVVLRPELVGGLLLESVGCLLPETGWRPFERIV